MINAVNIQVNIKRYLSIGRLVMLFVLASFQTLSAQQKKNVLFIVVDDLRPALGCYGDTLASSPNIDRLAKSGTVFKAAYCQQAVCAPSRASFMTGRKPDRTKVWNLETHFRTALPNVVTLPQHFKNNGYQSMQIGKIYHDPKKAQDPISWSIPEILAVTTNKGKYVLGSNLAKAPKATASEIANVPDSAYIDGMVADKVVSALRNIGTQPFFMAVGFRRPHLPFSVPLTFWKKTEGRKFSVGADTVKSVGAPKYAVHGSVELRGYTDIPDFGPIDEKLSNELVRGYYTAVSFVDAQIGKVLDELRRSGADKNTIVVLFSDHGFHLGEQGLWGKTTNTKIDTRVPLIVLDPTLGRQPKVSEELVQLVDLYATLSKLCNLSAPQTDGTSFAELLKGKPFAGKGMAFSQFPNQMKFEDRPEVMGYAVHTKLFRYTEWIELKTGKVLAKELYDYQVDPKENVNVAGNARYKNVISHLSNQIKSYRN